MIGRMADSLVWDRSTGGVILGGECGAPHINQSRVCGVAVQKCVNCRSCGFGVVRGVGRVIRLVPKLLWAILCNIYMLCMLTFLMSGKQFNGR